MSSGTVAAGKVVSLHYTLKDAEGETLDSSVGEEPLAYLHGADNIVPGLEKELTGSAVGDKRKVVVAPEDGYGARTAEPQAVPREAFPEEAPLEAGLQLVAEGPDGKEFPLWVVEVGPEEVIVDPNHPLAGATLHFDIEILAVRDATDEEKAHGHPHGPGGHHH